MKTFRIVLGVFILCFCGCGEPKFRYLDEIVVTSGFYRGHRGRVESKWAYGWSVRLSSGPRIYTNSIELFGAEKE